MKVAIRDPYNKSTSYWRWIVLPLACLMPVGSFYCFDIPSAIMTQLDDYMHKPSQFEIYFGLLYSLYAFPNAILPFFGGIFVDKLGVRLCLIIFTVLVTLGQILFCIGITTRSWNVIFVGRFVFGLGGECLIVSKNALTTRWFKDKELAFGLGIILTFSRVSSVTNNILSPILTQSNGLVFAVWFGVFMCVLSVASVVGIFFIDKSFDQEIIPSATPTIEFKLETIVDTDKEISTIEANEVSTVAPVAALANAWTAVKKFFSEMKSLSIVFWVCAGLCVVGYGCVLPFNNVASSLLLERDYFMVSPNDCHLTQMNACQSPLNPPIASCPTSSYYQPPLPYDITLSDGQYFPGQVTPGDVDCSLSVWADECAVEFCSRLSQGQRKVGVIMSIPYIITACILPFLGIIIDKFGFRAIIAGAAPMLLLVVHALLGWTKVSPVGPLIGQGLAYALFAAALWPAIPVVVEMKLTGLAFGIATAAFNLGCAIIPLIIASLYKQSDDQYIPNTEILFVVISGVGVLLGMFLNYYDYRYLGSILNRAKRPPSQSMQTVEEEDVSEGSESDSKDRQVTTVSDSFVDYMSVPCDSPKSSLYLRERSQEFFAVEEAVEISVTDKSTIV